MQRKKKRKNKNEKSIRKYGGQIQNKNGCKIKRKIKMKKIQRKASAEKY